MTRRSSLRILVLVLLLAAFAAAVVFLFTTPHGRHLVHDPHAFGSSARAWVRHHRVVAPLAVLVLYVVLALLALPVWWLQVLAGYGFGLWGVLLCDVGQSLAAVATAGTSRWLASDVVHDKLQTQRDRIRKLEELLGHNALLLVMAVRLSHVAPFGLSNHLFGLFRIPYRDIFAGTLLGGLPAVTLTVALGAMPHHVATFEFVTALFAMHVVLLTPLVLRYLKPDWFRRMGIE